MSAPALRAAIIGAGPVGLALALGWARGHPHLELTLYDGRPLPTPALDGEGAVADARTLALSLGSVQTLQRLDAWDAAAAQPITEVHVSQQPGGATLWPGPVRDRALRLKADALGVPLLGAVLGYDAVLRPLERAWLAACARESGRLSSRFGTRVAALLPVSADRGEPGPSRVTGIDVDAGIVDRYDLVVVAEGGVYAQQAPQSVRRGYAQTAWVGQVRFAPGGAPPRGAAFERFTRQGPAALLPLRDEASAAGGSPVRRAALVWCVPTDADPVAALDAEGRRALLDSVFHADAGRLASVGELKPYALGLNAVSRLVDGRIVRIGNAAQTLHPVAGQGLNLGLRDAAELARALSADRMSRHTLDGALRRVELSRAPDRWSMIAATDLLARAFTWQVPGAHALRSLGLAALAGARPAREALARQMLYGRR